MNCRPSRCVIARSEATKQSIFSCRHMEKTENRRMGGAQRNPSVLLDSASPPEMFHIKNVMLYCTLFVLWFAFFSASSIRGAKADSPSSQVLTTCDQVDTFFLFQSHSLPEADSPYAELQATGRSVKIMDFAFWAHHPVECDLRYDLCTKWVTHKVIVKATGYSVTNEGLQNATLNVILDGKLIFSKQNILGQNGDQSVIQFTQGFLWICTMPDINGFLPTYENGARLPKFSDDGKNYVDVTESCQRFSVFHSDVFGK